jgi:hypothetical protein
MAATIGQMLLSQIRSDAKSRADMVNSTFVTDAEWNAWANQGYSALYDLLAEKFSGTYFVQTAEVTTDGVNNQYALPDDFYKLLGVDLQLAGQSDAWLSVKGFNMGERNRYARPNAQTVLGLSNIRYRLLGANLYFSPRPAAGQVVRIWYVPRPAPLADAGTITVVGSSNGVPIGTLTLNGASISVNGGVSDNATATALAAAITAAGIPGVSATASQNVVSVSAGVGAAPAALPVTWSAGGTVMTLSPFWGWTPLVDGVSGWEQYIVLHAAVAALIKEESDPSQLRIEQAAIIERIEAAAENRDAANPQTVSDTRGGDLFYSNGSPDGWANGPGY